MKREVEISKMLDHPNIVKFLETYIDNDNIYIVMEYCTGGSLILYKYNEAEVLKIMKKLLYAIKYIHSRNIIHRDLKPDNILYENRADDSEIKIIDFGLAKNVPKKSTPRRHTIVGSSAFMGSLSFIKTSIYSPSI